MLRLSTAAAGGGYEVMPDDEAAMADLAGRGIDDPEDDPSVLVEPTTGTGSRLVLNQVSKPKTVEEPTAHDVLGPL